ncbi:hypothetical protein CVT25_012249 [Psilocybe cyanescens]|uniref:GPI mannosyltransferase 2 n=1 Tax=Psilocybe cyanescens TaxID=93625 RepID=A0A409XG15_PSICY|nr:hypothetical protein CVT25_012249 [Psilocybe cyanescens]
MISLFTLSILSRFFFFCLLQLSYFLPLFDTSPLLLSISTPLRPLLRWDTFHFLHIASDGYVFEHEWAFLPSLPLIMRTLASGFAPITGSFKPSNMLLSGVLAVLASDTTQTLYDLSLHHLRSPELSLVATLLSLIPTSPVTLFFAPYNEPFFTFFSYHGMLYCTQQKWFLASASFALAGTFRSNGIFLSGFILWGLVISPFLNGIMPTSRMLLKSIFLTAIVIGPFVIYHITTYSIFCTTGTSPVPEWCSRIPPSLYTYVQSTYWNSGFLLYWTLGQLPNFVIATPTILLLSAFSFHHLRNTSLINPKNPKTDNPFGNPTLTPHVIHAIIFTCILVFASHTQIILRVAASMPIVYWAAAWLLLEYPKLGRIWVMWSVLWGIISTILWAAFLPPA